MTGVSRSALLIMGLDDVLVHAVERLASNDVITA